MDLRNRQIPAPIFRKGGESIPFTLTRQEVSGNLLDIEDNNDTSPIASPMVSHIHTPTVIGYHDSNFMAHEDQTPSTSGLGNDVRSILMEIKETFTNQINDLRSEVQTIKSQMSPFQNQGTCRLNFSQNSAEHTHVNSDRQDNQVVHNPQFAAGDNGLSQTTSVANGQQFFRDEPKPRSPLFTGKGNFKAFWTQYSLLCSRFHWSNDRQVEELLLNCLRDDALVYVNELPFHVRADINQIYRSMEQRFGDHILPDTYRTNLQFVKQVNKESLHDYAARVEKLVTRAYPEILEVTLLDRFKTEHFLKGLPDQSVAYEVLIQKPSTMQEAINMVSWHECCRKNVGRKCEIRQIEAEKIPGEQEVFEVCRTQAQYVTHSDLKSSLDQLKKEHKSDIEEVKKGNEKLTKLVSNINSRLNQRQDQWTSPNQKSYRGKENYLQKNSSKTIVCYFCNQEGHISKYCPFKKASGKESEQGNSGTQSQMTGKQVQSSHDQLN